MGIDIEYLYYGKKINMKCYSDIKWIRSILILNRNLKMALYVKINFESDFCIKKKTEKNLILNSWNLSLIIKNKT